MDKKYSLHYSINIDAPKNHLLKVKGQYLIDQNLVGRFLRCFFKKPVPTLTHIQFTNKKGEILHHRQVAWGEFYVDLENLPKKLSSDLKIEVNFFYELNLDSINEEEALLQGSEIFLLAHPVQNDYARIELKALPLWSHILTDLEEISTSRHEFIYLAHNAQELIKSEFLCGCYETSGFNLEGFNFYLIDYDGRQEKFLKKFMELFFKFFKAPPILKGKNFIIRDFLKRNAGAKREEYKWGENYWGSDLWAQGLMECFVILYQELFQQKLTLEILKETLQKIKDQCEKKPGFFRVTLRDAYLREEFLKLPNFEVKLDRNFEELYHINPTEKMSVLWGLLFYQIFQMQSQSQSQNGDLSKSQNLIKELLIKLMDLKNMGEEIFLTFLELELKNPKYQLSKEMWDQWIYYYEGTEFLKMPTCKISRDN
jgi:hypothetical protein